MDKRFLKEVLDNMGDVGGSLNKAEDLADKNTPEGHSKNYKKEKGVGKRVRESRVSPNTDAVQTGDAVDKEGREKDKRREKARKEKYGESGKREKPSGDITEPDW